MNVVMFSSGTSSWAAAKLVALKHGTDDLTLLFADVRGKNPSPHAGEDPDNYRFLFEAAANVGGNLVTLNAGRDIWEVYNDEHMLGNSRVAPCSKQLKQIPARKWVEANCDPADSTLYVGMDFFEVDRQEGNRKAWLPYTVEFPVFDARMGKAEVTAWLASEGLRRPELYDLNYQHANCGGWCCRMGQAQARQLLRTKPERYAYHEAKEQEFREKFAKDVAFLKHRSGPKKDQPLTMRELRERVEAQPELPMVDDESGCDQCFTQVDPAPVRKPQRGCGVKLGPLVVSGRSRGNLALSRGTAETVSLGY